MSPSSSIPVGGRSRYQRVVARFGLLGASLVLILGLGATAVLTSGSASHQAEHIRQGDRAAQQHVLAGLTSQYLGLGLRSELQFVDSHQVQSPFALAVQDGVLLNKFAQSSDLFRAGGVALVDQHLQLVAASTNALAPPTTDPGYRPLMKALAGARPAVSGVMQVHGRWVVALGVPILTKVQQLPSLRGALIGYLDLLSSDLETYTRTLSFVGSGDSVVTDSNGVTVVAKRGPQEIGTRAPDAPPISVMRQLAAKARAKSANGGYTSAIFYNLKAHGRSYATAFEPLTVSGDVDLGPEFGVITLTNEPLGGWFSYSTQPSHQFFGPIQSSGHKVDLVILGVLIAAVILLAIAHHKRQAALRELADQALYDPLTSLPNRRLFQNRVELALARQRRSGQTVSVLFCDLDNFKDINDRLGHELGDLLLIDVAQRLNGCLRSDDTVSRLGGDEFTVLLESVADEEEAIQVAQRLRRAVEEPLLVAGHDVQISMSVGVAVLTAGGGGIPELMRAADVAMYRAKARALGVDVTVLSPGAPRAEQSVVALPDPRVSSYDDSMDLDGKAER